MENPQLIMLFSPPLAPVPVSQSMPVVIGRQAQCELSIPHSDVSRQHAEVSFEDGQFVLRDLGSTNGTYLNGKEINAPVALSSGDKIEMGSRVVTFCELESDEFTSSLESDCEKTMIALPTPQVESFAGDLAQIPPCAVLQVLEMGSKSGVIEIGAGGDTTRIWFKGGVPVHAASSKLLGFEAALGVVNVAEGRFRFEPQTVDVEATINCTVTELLMEGCRLMDEEGR